MSRYWSLKETGRGYWGKSLKNQINSHSKSQTNLLLQISWTLSRKITSQCLRCWRIHCVKIVQIRSYFWSVFSLIRTEYGEIRSIWTLHSDNNNYSIIVKCIWERKNFYEAKSHFFAFFWTLYPPNFSKKCPIDPKLQQSAWHLPRTRIVFSLFPRNFQSNYPLKMTSEQSA